MKQFIFTLALMLIAISANATTKITLEYEDVIDTTDTATVRVDTVYSDWREMTDGIYFNYALKMIGGAKDTNWTGDTYALALELSWDQTANMRKIIALASFVDDSVLVPDTTWALTPKLLPPWWRIRMIHTDSIGVGESDSALVHTVAPYTKEVQMLYLWRE